MNDRDATKPTLIWWGRADPAYSRNAMVRAAMRELGWAIHDYRPSKAVGLGLVSPRGLPSHASLVWVPCFRQRDMRGAARWAARLALPLVFDPLISAYDKQVYEREKFAQDSSKAKRLLEWERHVFSLADHIVADTQAHADYFIEQLTVEPGKTSVVPVSAETQHFKPTPHAAMDGRRIQVLFYGSFIELQAPHVIAEAAMQCDEVDWCLLGDGPLKSRCVDIAGGAEHVRFEPWTAYDRLPQIIASADIVLGVFSRSKKAGRVVPNKVYQAMACARSVVTRTPLPGAWPWGNDHESTEANGLVTVAPQAPDALAAAVTQLASDPSRIERLGQAAYQAFKQYGSPASVKLAMQRVFEAVAPLAGGR